MSRASGQTSGRTSNLSSKQARVIDGAMNPLENVRMAFEALWGNRLRSFLALLGIIIGVFAVTSMVSLGEMANASISRDLESVAGRSLFVQPDFNNTGVSSYKRITDADIQALSSLPVSVIPQVSSNAEYEVKPGERRNIGLNGSPGDLPRLDPTSKIARGRFFSDAEANASLSVAVLNHKAAQDIFKSRNPVGQNLRLYIAGDRVDVTVVGVLEPPPGLFGGFGGGTIYVPNRFAWQVMPYLTRNEYDFAQLMLKPGASSQRVQDQVQRLLESRYGVGKFQVQSAESFQSLLQNITLALQALLASTAALSLLVGGIGIMNIMLVSVTERTREIGLRKALGATSAQVRQQFLIEAVVLTLTGGVMGVLLAIVVLQLAVLAVPFFKVFILNPGTVFLALGVSVLIGLFFGVWPAARAAKLDPIEALRYE
jgi:putative ABC transport system permease protein